MGNNEFEKIVKSLVAEYTNNHVDKSDGVRITEDDVFIVWYCKTLQNNKALASTTLFDGMYYELTYNGDKHEIYFDAYKKWENKFALISVNKDKNDDEQETYIKSLKEDRNEF